MKIKRKRLHFEKNIRFRERMLLIYIIGGIIPFLGITIYSSNLIGKDMVKASKTFQQNMVSMLAAELERDFPAAERLAEQLCGDTELQRMIETGYEGESQTGEDQAEIQAIKQYRQDYAESISNITIYVENRTICYEEPFAYLDETAKNERWYQETCQAGESGYWQCEEGEENKIQFFSLLKNDAEEPIGVVVIQLNSTVLENNIQDAAAETLVLCDDQTVVFSNFMPNQNSQFLWNKIQESEPEADTLHVNQRVDEYLLTYQRVRPSGLGSVFTVACFQDYQQIKGQLNRTNLDSYSIIALSLFASVLMIIAFSNAFGARLQTLRRQMHLVANGRYDEVEPISGNDEVAEIYQEVEKMMGDIQELTSNMVEEKVQKEKLHTRQKEVEFKMLASQINPHFLYNTLETIRMKARVNEQKEIEDLVKMLAKIMRRNIQVSNQMVTLRSEVELTENYLKIQDYRFGDRIVSRLEVDPEMDLEMEVMPLIIQPFVENAFVHGLEAMPEQGKLLIEITQDSADVIIRIIDNGVGMPYYKLAELRHILNTGESEDQTHIGINNVNQRLKIQYGNAYGVRMDSREQEGTTIEIRFPRTYNFSGKNI